MKACDTVERHTFAKKVKTVGARTNDKGVGTEEYQLYHGSKAGGKFIPTHDHGPLQKDSDSGTYISSDSGTYVSSKGKEFVDASSDSKYLTTQSKYADYNELKQNYEEVKRKKQPDIPE